MRRVSISDAKKHSSALLDEVDRGETIVITRRKRPVAWLRPPEGADRRSANAAATTLRDLCKRVGWATTEEILQMRGQGRV